jgi:glycerate 2-kinase
MVKNIPINSPYLKNIPIAPAIVSILQSAFGRVEPCSAVQNAVKVSDDSMNILGHHVPIQKNGRLMVLGLGKAAQTMAIGLKSALPERICAGAVITKHSLKELEMQLLPEIVSYEGDHPVPTEKSVSAARCAIGRIGKLTSEDILISLISGGGSALAVLPRPGITLAEYQVITKLLLGCGASVQEINAIRKQVDLIKGGELLNTFFPASVISLILSDVVGDPLDVIASGPTVFSGQTRQDARNVIAKYHLQSKIPASIRLLLESEPEKGREKADEQRDGRYILNVLVGNSSIAADAVKETAQNYGFHAQVVSTTLQGEAREVGARLGKELKDEVQGKNRKSCRIFGGETTVTIQGNGKGGRNQELVLSAAQEIAGIEGGCILSIATDGEDGPTDAAGAIADGKTAMVGAGMGLDLRKNLENNDAYSYFDAVGGLVKTGPSGTNVNDLVLLFTY